MIFFPKLKTSITTDRFYGIILFLSFFAYLATILIFSRNAFVCDEARYMEYASNLLHGTYVTGDKYHLNLMNGPGYPLLLMPFVALHAPLLSLKIFNAFLMFGAVIYLFYSLRFFISFRKSVFAALIFGLYPPNFVELPLIMSETAATFFMCGFCYYFLDALLNKKNAPLFLAAFFISMVALTKVIFGYILAACIVVFAVAALLRRSGFSRAFIICLFGLLGTVPYLLYTYNLTGRPFYWSVLGGDQLYYLTSPFENELGDIQNQRNDINPGFIKNHQSFYKIIDAMSTVERDEILKKQAIINIAKHPMKFLKNYAANLCRMFINFPYSYTPQSMRSLFYIIPGMFLVVFFAISVTLAIFGRRGLMPRPMPLFVFGLIATAATSAVSAYSRMALVLIPIMFIWIVFVFSGTITISLKKLPQ